VANILRSIDNVVTQQALIVGRVSDGLTGRQTVYPIEVELRYRTGAGQPPRRLPLTPRIDPSGLFVFTGLPATAFPRVLPGETLELRLAVSAPRYQPQEIDLTLTDADLGLTDYTLSAGALTATASVLSAPVVEQIFELLPEPVGLAGRVVSADDPEHPIPGAEIRVTAPDARGPVTADADGFFTLHDLPIAEEITVRVSASPDFVNRVITVRLDYRQPVNGVTLPLEPV
jgi:hypothetical protein